MLFAKVYIEVFASQGVYNQKSYDLDIHNLTKSIILPLGPGVLRLSNLARNSPSLRSPHPQRVYRLLFEVGYLLISLQAPI